MNYVQNEMGQFQIKAEGYQDMLFKYKFKDDGEYEVNKSNFMLKFPPSL